MRNITFSADEHLIEQARSVARSRGRTLNEDFREWLERYAAADRAAVVARYEELMKRLSYVKIGRKLTRDELNER